MRILIDTGAIYAIVTRTDRHHEAAVAFTQEVSANKDVFLLADLVFAETMTLLKARLGTSIALQVGKVLRRNPICIWTPLGPDYERETWALFQQYDDKDWSYSDCALLALARRLGIKEVFTFDHHFSQMPEVERVP